MAVPTAPTLVSLTTDALNDAGLSSPTATQLARAQGSWMEEIKNDIVAHERRLTSLQTTSILVTTNGQSRYILPTDYLSDLTLTILDGVGTNTAQAGTISSITFSADDTSESGDVIGSEILVTANTAKSSMSQATVYSTVTKIASVTPDFNTAPDGTSEYMQITRYIPLTELPVWEFDKLRDNQRKGTPEAFFPVGDSDNGEFILDPVPFRDSAVPFGMQLRYYADLMELDLTGTLMATLYKKWRNVWVKGVYWRQLKEDDDNRQEVARGDYENELFQMITHEKYGYDLSNLNSTVQGYS